MNAYLYKSNQLFLVFVIFLGGFTQAYATEKMDENSMSVQQLKKQISYESEEFQKNYEFSKKIYELEEKEENAEVVALTYEGLAYHKPLESQKYKESQKKLYESFYKKYPENENVLSGYCWFNLLNNYFNESEEVCRDSLYADFLFSSSYFNMGHVLYKKGYTKEAEILFESGLIGTDTEIFDVLMKDFEKLSYIYNKKEAETMTNKLQKKMKQNYLPTIELYNTLYDNMNADNNEEAVKTNAKLLTIIANTLGENSIRYAYHTQLQATFYSDLNNVEKTVELRQKADNLYKKMTLGGKKFENNTTKTNLLLLRLIKMAD